VIEPRVPARKRAQIEDTIDATEQQLWSALSAERKELLRLIDKAITALEPLAAAR